MRNFNVLTEVMNVSEDCAAQYHRASKKNMAYVRPILQRIKETAQKKLKVKLTGFSYIRQHDLGSHTTKVADRSNRSVYICLMLGKTLYLEEFVPDEGGNSVYVIEGFGSPPIIIVTAEMLNNIFRCIPRKAYDLKGNRCAISKDDFMAGVHAYADRQQISPNSKRKICREDSKWRRDRAKR